MRSKPRRPIAVARPVSGPHTPPPPEAGSFAELWARYEPISQRDNDSWGTDRGRAAHLCRHLGRQAASQLSQVDVDAYRAARMREKTIRGMAPSPGTLDREVELAKRVLAYAVKCKRLTVNPLAGVSLLRKPNIRGAFLDVEAFFALLANADQRIRPLLIVAYDTGMRIRELLGMRWEDVDFTDGKNGTVSLMDATTNAPRKVYLTQRAGTAMKALPRSPCGYVFTHEKTGERLFDVRKSFKSAAAKIGRSDLWFHDLRRSFITRARRAGIDQATVMRMSGHKTASVFKRYNIVEEQNVARAARTLNAIQPRLTIVEGGQP